MFLRNGMLALPDSELLSDTLGLIGGTEVERICHRVDGHPDTF